MPIAQECYNLCPIMSRSLLIFLYCAIAESLKFKPKPSNTNLELNSKSVVHCKVDGQSPAVVRWRKEGSTHLPLHVSDANGVLTFDVVQYSDAGFYTCVATSDQGMINATVYLGVVGK